MTLGEYIAEQVRRAIDESLSDNEELLTSIAEAGGSKAGDGLLGDVHDFASTITGIIGALPIVGDLVDLPLTAVKDIAGGAGKFGGAMGLGYMLGYLAFPLAEPLLLPLVHEVNANTTNLLFDPQTAATLVAKGIIAQDYAFSEASGGGLDNQHEGSLIEAARQYPALAETLEMLNRGMITDAQALTALQRDGLHPDYMDAALSLRSQLLSPADLALASLRGIITDADARVLALKTGLAADDFEVIVGNTGEPPGLMQLLEAYRRGFIDQATLERGIRQSRVRDEWIPMVEKLRYSPMSVADAARAVVENYMPADQGAAIAQENGLQPDHWPLILESWGRPLAVGEMLTLMHRGQATVDQVKQALRESDIKDKYIDQAVQLGRRLIPERQVVSMIDHSVINHDQGVALLKEWGYTDADATAMVNLGTAQHVGSHHTLSKGDTLAMYTDALINRQEATKYLVALGYTDALAGQMLDLADYKQKAALVKVTMRGIEAQLKAHQIDTSQATDDLIKAGLDHTQATVYVDEWVQSRKVATRTLTEAQVIKAVKDGVISVSDGRVRLEAYGLSAQDVDILFKIEGFVPYTPLKVG